jgi:hypothetical protein
MMSRLVVSTLLVASSLSPVLAFIGHANLVLPKSRLLNSFAVKAAGNQRGARDSIYHSVHSFGVVRAMLDEPLKNKQHIEGVACNYLKTDMEPVGVGISFYPDDENEGLLQVHAVAPYTSAKQSGIQVLLSVYSSQSINDFSEVHDFFPFLLWS